MTMADAIQTLVEAGNSVEDIREVAFFDFDAVAEEFYDDEETA